MKVTFWYCLSCISCFIALAAPVDMTDLAALAAAYLYATESLPAKFLFNFVESLSNFIIF
jgi:hypothetical protein